MEDSLFRPEVMASRTRRLHGDVVLSQALPIRVVGGALAAIIVACGLWLSLGSFARTELARGTLVTIVPSTKIIAPSTGVVSSLLVGEGSRVRKGDRLVAVTVDRRSEDGRGYAANSLSTVLDRMALSDAQVRHEEVRLSGELLRLKASLMAARRDVDDFSGQIELQKEIVASNQRMFEQIEQVVDRGFVSRHDYERRRQTLLSSRQALSALRQQRSAAISRLEQSRAELSVLSSKSAAQVEEIKSGRLALEQQVAQLRAEQAYSIAAPADGRVTALQTAAGRTTSAGSNLMTIVPERAMLRAEVYAPSRAIGLVKPGQEARLLYDAFPYQRFGSFAGRILTVSRIAIEPRENETAVEAQEPVYRVTIALERQRVDAFGYSARLQPGMTLTANIVLERQSFFAWLLTPLRAVMNRNS